MNSIKPYVLVTCALFFLLALTVGAAYIDLGAFNTPVALLISLSKGTLIVLVFMNVRHSSPLIHIFVLVGVFWLGIMLTLSLSDFLTRHP